MFDRSKLHVRPLAERVNKLQLAQLAIDPDAPPPECSDDARDFIQQSAEAVRAARAAGRPVILAFGAHAIKNGLGPVLVALMRDGWLTHLATNGAGVIHDWEFAFQGESGEDVRAHVAEGMFGLWQETGMYINLALLVGAWQGKGYGASIGSMIAEECLTIPTDEQMAEVAMEGTGFLDRVAAGFDLMNAINAAGIKPGRMEIPHPFKAQSVQAEAWRLGIPFTGHPMFGHDIIYTHPLNSGAAIGRTAHTDFLTYAGAVQDLQDGVYLSVGSAVMSPMIFEKSLSMARNVAHQEGKAIDRFFLGVADLAPSTWDWQNDGEPPVDNPAYYLRYLKTFSRMGGTMRYGSIDNRAFFLGLRQALKRSME
ncbi:MAG: hypothetical protein FWG50_02520 [Kiritimatiellaeota bacterium]|nr:hypothetical protein [Kiritimatiellota bacterium]